MRRFFAIALAILPALASGGPRLTVPSLGGAPGGAPGGSTTQIQYNDAGAFGGTPDMTWTAATPELYAKNLRVSTWNSAADPAHGLSWATQSATQGLALAADPLRYGELTLSPYNWNNEASFRVTNLLGTHYAVIDSSSGFKHFYGAGWLQASSNGTTAYLSANTPLAMSHLSSLATLDGTGGGSFTLSGAKLNLGSMAVATPASGDMWWTGTALNFYNGTTTKDLLAGGSGANALGTYLVQTATNAPVNAQVMGALGTGLVKNTTTTGVQSIAASGTDYGPPTSGLATGIVKSTTGTGAHTIATSGTDYAPGTSALGTGIVKTTTGTGALSVAASGTDYGPPTSGNATGLVISTTGTGAHTAYTGVSAVANQWITALSALGAGTLAQPAFTNISGTATIAQLPTVTVAKGGSNLTTVAANQVYVGTAADTFTAKTIPSCSGATNALTFDNATQTVGCNTITGGTPTFAGLTSGAVMYANSTTTITSQASAGTAGNILTSGGAGASPAWVTLVPIANGGTNSSATATTGGVGYGTGTAHAYTAAGTAWQSLHGGASAPAWGASSAYTLTTATWASSATANTLGIVGTGATPLTSPTYAAAAPFSFRCVVPMTRPSTVNQPRYGIQSSGTVTTINATAVIGLAGTAPARTEAMQDITTLATASCAAGCTANVITGGAARAFVDTIEGSGVMNATGTISLVMAPSAAAAHTAQIGARCEWY